MKRLLAALAAALMVVIVLTPASPAQAVSACTRLASVVKGWGPPKLAEEFNYTGAPDPLKWGVYDSAGHKGNGLRRPSQITVNGSNAVITGLSNGTTGGMAMKGSGRTYGKFEVCMKTNARDPKYHPVALLWPSNSADYAAKCWEIDFAEGGGNVDSMSFFNHYGCPSVQSYRHLGMYMTEWHAFAVEWSPAGVIGYVNGNEWFRDTTPSHISNVRMFLALQLDWFPNGTATKTSQMFVDHVRIY